MQQHLQRKKMRLRVIFFLVYFVYLWRHQTCLGNNYSLDCLNDYLFTITCKLNVFSKLPTQDGAYCLEFIDDRGTFRCELKSQMYSWVCVLNLSLLVKDSFTDTDFFEINLNSSLNDTSSLEVLSMPTQYEPVKNIQPVPPSNLTLLLETDNTTFHWLSGYKADVPLVPHLTYQLSIRSSNQNLTIHSTDTHVLVPVSTFTPNTNYIAQVRSEPSQNHYKGVWSQWGPAIHWTTSTAKNSGVDTSLLLWLGLFLLLLLPIGFVLCYLMKRYVSIPSPVPFIEDFEHFATPLPILEELLQQEESLKIEIMTKDCDSAFQPSPVHCEKKTNPFDTSGNATVADTPNMLHFSVESKTNFTAGEKESLIWSVDYCTLTHPPNVEIHSIEPNMGIPPG